LRQTKKWKRYIAASTNENSILGTSEAGSCRYKHSYLRPRNRAAAKRVREALQRCLGHIATFVELGRMQDEGVRKVVEPRFGYLIYYDIDKTGNVINVVTIQHPKRDRP
jgi:plasmid stabilization system protein ParE